MTAAGDQGGDVCACGHTTRLWHDGCGCLTCDCKTPRPAVARQDQGTGGGKRCGALLGLATTQLRCVLVRGHDGYHRDAGNDPAGLGVSWFDTARTAIPDPAAVADRDTTLRALRDGLNDDGGRAVLRERLEARLAERLIPFVWSQGDVDGVLAEIVPVILDEFRAALRPGGEQ